MTLFFQDLGQYVFLQRALLAALLGAVACGVVGSYVVVRRNTYIAGSIAHCVLAGLGGARYLQSVHGIEWMTPFTGALAAALLAAAVAGLATLYARQRMDTVLSILWALGMALGISFISATPGYREDLMSYLFGNILMVTDGDLVIMAILDGVILLVAGLCYHRFQAVCFDEELARLKGVRVELYELLFLLLTALTVVLLVQVVGIILVIALLTLPAATAAVLTRRLSLMMAAAMLIAALVSVGGLALSYGPEWPAGATIIELAAVLYLLTLLGRRVFNRRRRSSLSGHPASDDA